MKDFVHDRDCTVSTLYAKTGHHELACPFEESIAKNHLFRNNFVPLEAEFDMRRTAEVLRSLHGVQSN